MSKTFPVAAVTLFLESFRREISLGELTRQDHQRWIYFQDFKLLRESPMMPFGNQLGFSVESKLSKEIKNKRIPQNPYELKNLKEPKRKVSGIC